MKSNSSMEDLNDRSPLNSEKEADQSDYDAILGKSEDRQPHFAEKTALGEVAN